MYAYGSAIYSPPSRKIPGPPSEELRIAVTFPRPDGGHGPTKSDIRLSLKNVKDFVPDPLVMERAIYELRERKVKLTGRGRLTASMRCTKDQFQQLFQTRLEPVPLDPNKSYAFHSFYFPPKGSSWTPILEDLIDDACIQWPQIYMTPNESTSSMKKSSGRDSAVGGPPIPSVKPPQVDYFHLEMPNDVPSLLNATKVHQEGMRGEGIRVVMIDTGFAHGGHPFFAANGFRSMVDLAPGAVNDKADVIGHGTGESTNFFSVAPCATFIGVKLMNDHENEKSASMLEGFQRALQHKPHIISVSWGSDLRDDESKHQLPKLPRNLIALEAEILAAVASGIIVVFSAGNGEFAFPGMMPDVISVGGVFVDQYGNKQASDMASAYDSKIYSGRHVPDFCGLVGMKPRGEPKMIEGKPVTPLDKYIMLPVPACSLIDVHQLIFPEDGTEPFDGWAAFSGTSAAAPQIAGVCALLKQKDPSLTPSDIKAVLRRTARGVLTGESNPDSSDDHKAQKAGPGDAGAVGAGLVDAYSAWQQV